MLTISSDRHYTLSIQAREKFWSKTLILALCFTLGLHGAGFLLFKVKSVTCRQCQIILDPITVAMETPVLIQQEILANQSTPQTRLPPKPKHIPSPPLVRDNSHLPAVTFPLSQRKEILSPPPLSAAPSISVTLLGALADRQVVNAPDEVEIFGPPRTTHYSVTIDNRTGSILWIDPLDDLAKILIQWHFDPFEGEVLTKGELEVSFR